MRTTEKSTGDKRRKVKLPGIPNWMPELSKNSMLWYWLFRPNG